MSTYWQNRSNASHTSKVRGVKLWTSNHGINKELTVAENSIFQRKNRTISINESWGVLTMMESQFFVVSGQPLWANLFNYQFRGPINQHSTEFKGPFDLTLKCPLYMISVAWQLEIVVLCLFRISTSSQLYWLHSDNNYGFLYFIYSSWPEQPAFCFRPWFSLSIELDNISTLLNHAILLSTIYFFMALDFFARASSLHSFLIFRDCSAPSSDIFIYRESSFIRQPQTSERLIYQKSSLIRYPFLSKTLIYQTSSSL